MLHRDDVFRRHAQNEQIAIGVRIEQQRLLRGLFGCPADSDLDDSLPHDDKLRGTGLRMHLQLAALGPTIGVVVMPHLHSASGENFSAGDTLTPAAYQRLFARLGARLFSDERMLDEVLGRHVVDLERDVTPDELGDEGSLTLVATRRPDVFRRYELAADSHVRGEIAVNPLYRIEKRGPNVASPGRKNPSITGEPPKSSETRSTTPCQASGLSAAS